MKWVQESQGYTWFWFIVVFIALIASFFTGGVSNTARITAALGLLLFIFVAVGYYITQGYPFIL